jgi:hypothetical protein
MPNMQIRELSKKLSSTKLNESLAKDFGIRLDVDRMTNRELTAVRLKLAEKIQNFEKTSSFDSVLENRDYQKNRALLSVVRQAIAERTLSEQESTLKRNFLRTMKGSLDEFHKRYGERAVQVMETTATKMAKKKDLKEALKVLEGVLSERTLNEGEEEKAALIMSARDMVDRVTGWLEDVASMKSESMLELEDSIRDEMGNDVAQQYSTTVKPALEELYTSLEQHRATLTQAVGILTGEEIGGAPAGGMPAPAGGEMPATMGAPDAETGDEFGAAEAATGGMEAAGRMKRESVEYSRKLGTILSSKKK